jgi:hypothetical protein
MDMKIDDVIDLITHRAIEKFGSCDVFISVDPYGIWTRIRTEDPWHLTVKREELPTMKWTHKPTTLTTPPEC